MRPGGLSAGRGRRHEVVDGFAQRGGARVGALHCRERRRCGADGDPPASVETRSPEEPGCRGPCTPRCRSAPKARGAAECGRCCASTPRGRGSPASCLRWCRSRTPDRAPRSPAAWDRVLLAPPASAGASAGPPAPVPSARACSSAASAAAAPASARLRAAVASSDCTSASDSAVATRAASIAASASMVLR